MARGSNLSRLGDFNQTVLFDAIRRAPAGISRVELVSETGLTAQTVSNIVRRLLDEGMVVEGGRVQTAVRGKPRTLVRVRPTARYAVGVHVDPATLTFVLIDVAGQVHQYARRRTPQAPGPDDVVAVIRDEVQRLLAAADLAPGALLGLGVAAPGPLDVLEGTLLNPPQLAGWAHVRLRADLREATGLHVLVDKDVTAAATGERWAQGGARHHFVFCYLGAGLGAGVVMDDTVLRGASNNIGEIGNILVAPGAEDLGIGPPGSLAATCLPQALVVRAQRLGLVPAGVGSEDFVGVDEVFTEICERAYAGDARCLELIDDAAAGLAAGLAVMVNFLDVDRVVLGGPIWSRISSRMLEVLPALVQPQLVAASGPLVIEGSAVGEHVAAQGAAALVLDHFLSPRPAVLVMD
ncbi:Sugar kinase of the NBD/HSP70 family, may contain an N-terminal HTH domain [Friedmanniella luteola]|uniref:Sugar kinase of the NBD/HSP70 family, may contain an N-terminal HTH domain n=1 Tax=Friedmanniella luteola TaxID=546871 RepID=A0A1H1L1F0_9ACTN|nr:ROK family transcriptional regulator [Friedmanniella luteola]SDR68217.1 Sugar kinase of the NBD/HSP70 family, may contain an N-terminal HTH domain [Friedmanniella luteola]